MGGPMTTIESVAGVRFRIHAQRACHRCDDPNKPFHSLPSCQKADLLPFIREWPSVIKTPQFLVHEAYGEDFFFDDKPKQGAKEGDLIVVKLDENFVIGTVGKPQSLFNPIQTLYSEANRRLAQLSYADDDEQKSADEAWLIARSNPTEDA